MHERDDRAYNQRIARNAHTMPTPTTLPIAQIIPRTAAEGPGERFAIWLQGCPLRCPGCCNPEMLPFDGGVPTPVDELVSQIIATDGIEGITLLGGEPFAHAAGLAPLACEIRRLELSVMIFSGYTLEELHSQSDPAVDALLSQTDILVDGPYRNDLPETGRRWIGSKNQQIHFLTDRCNPADPRWREPNTLEVRLDDGELTVNGFPARDAVSLWRRPSSQSKTPHQ